MDLSSTVQLLAFFVQLYNLAFSLGDLVFTTPLERTAGNPIIVSVHHLMLAAADGFLGLIVVIWFIQKLYGQATGALTMPISRFLPRVVVVVILMHMSSMIGQDLVILNNELCKVIHIDMKAFMLQMNDGKPYNPLQVASFSGILGFFFTLSFIRLIIQAGRRLILFNLLFVLSGPALLMSAQEATMPWFAFWARTYVVTIFIQFFQVLALGLAIQFVISYGGNSDGVGFFLAILALNTIAEIPGLLNRFAASIGANAGGIGTLVRGAMTLALLLR